jgi:hypothetical protein
MDVQTATVVIASISVIIATINSIISSRRAEQQRQMQLFTQIYSHFLHKDFAENWDRIMYVLKTENWAEIEHIMSQSNRESAIAFGHVGRLIGYACVGINRGVIDIDIVDDLIANRIIEYWEKYGFLTAGLREAQQDPTLGDDVEAAYKLLKTRRQQRIALALQQQTTST